MPLFQVVSEGDVKALVLEAWNAPPRRYFIAYRCSRGLPPALGLPVIDEFATFSSPVFFAPAKLLGRVYNLGITLGHMRDADMNIDTGWPPLCIGLDSGAAPADGWEDRLLAAIKKADVGRAAEGNVYRSGSYLLQTLETPGASIIATDAPLLPRQLRRVCETAPSVFAVAFSVGNRIQRSEDGSPLSVEVASEHVLETIMKSLDRTKL